MITPPAAPPADPSPEALDVAETLINHQWGVSVYRLALALDAFRREGVEQERARLKNAIVPYDDLWAGERRIQ
jgi:hypothetical protein